MFVEHSTIAFCSASGALSDLPRNGMHVVAVICGAKSIFAFIEAGQAYGQAQQEGGNGQAQSKFSNNLVAGFVYFILTALVEGVFLNMVTNLITSS